ncbi:hypothetical protein BVX94_03070 [bacterium B17]|nr:hypothetical protein BVX94_03070 [bacterium B17]
MQFASVIVFSIVGAAVSALAACLPGLHVYSLLGLLYMVLHSWVFPFLEISSDILVSLTAGMVTGYAVVNTLPSIMLSAPDESSFFTVMPGNKLVRQGRGYEAVMITSMGSLAGLLLIVFILGPSASRVLPLAWYVLKDHTRWILWCVICFMLMSEWPKGGDVGQGGVRKFIDGWRSTGAGIFVFVLSGLLGIVLLNRSPISASASFQNLLPAFVGLFTLPSLVMNVLSKSEIPKQSVSGKISLGPGAVIRGSLAGCLGGGFAAFFPVITGGVGGLLAGHASALRDDRSFLVSQGASKLVYYVGSFLMFFVPVLTITRGSAARLVRGVHVSGTYADYYMVLGAIALAGMLSLLAIGPLTKLMIRLIEQNGYRRIAATSLSTAVLIVFLSTGFSGLGVMAVGVGIGLMPLLYGTRRMNCLGVILLPMAVS